MVTEGRLRLATEQAKLSPAHRWRENLLKHLLVTSGGLRVYNSAFAFLRFACPRAKEAMFNVGLDSLLSFAAPVCLCRRRPYLSEHTGSLSTSEVKRRRDWPRGLAGKRVGFCSKRL